MDYSTIKSYFTIREEHGDKAKAICPAHPDKEASLSINYNREKGATGIYCHAGCDIEDILNRVGLKQSDLFDEPLQQSRLKDKSNNIEAVYKYTDEKGKVIFEKIRFRPKKFSQRRYVGDAVVWGLEAGTYYETFNGSNAWSMKARETVSREFEGIEPVVYNLPGIKRAFKNEEPVFVVEGEKDADNLIKIELTATTSFDGASKSKQKQKWRESYNKYFEGVDVVLIPDNDEPGKAHMTAIAKSLWNVANSIKILNLPNLEEKEDTTDWLDYGGTKEKLLQLVENTEAWDPSLEPEDVSLLFYNFSDVGNSERFIAMYNKIVRYNPVRKKWLIWSGKHWRMDFDGRIESLARKTVKTLQKQGLEIKEIKEDDIELKKEIRKFVLRSENDARIRAIVNQAKTESNIVIREMDRNPYLLNLKNGTLNLKTGKLQEHNRKDFITKLVDIKYEAKAKCPNWTEFINKIFLGNTELIEYIQKSLGYSLTGDANLQCFYLLHGQGSNGKGTFMKAVLTILGDYAAVLKGSSLMERVGDEGARGDLAKLEGKYFVCVNELEDGKSFDEALVKSLSSGADEAIPVRRMYEEEFDLHPTFKMWMTTNKLPKIKGTDNGIWRRVRKIPFEYNFENDEDKDEHFFENKLLPEISGILNWAIEGCMKWQKEGMHVPDIVKYAIEDYKNDMDVIQRFIEECCIVSETCKVKRANLYEAYCLWCKENKEYTLSSRKLNKKLTEKNFQEAKTMGIYYWKGIGLSTNEYKENLFQYKDNIQPFVE